MSERTRGQGSMPQERGTERCPLSVLPVRIGLTRKKSDRAPAQTATGDVTINNTTRSSRRPRMQNRGNGLIIVGNIWLLANTSEIHIDSPQFPGTATRLLRYDLC